MYELFKIKKKHKMFSGTNYFYLSFSLLYLKTSCTHTGAQDLI